MIGLTFEVRHNNKRWIVTRRRNEFLDLHQKLTKDLQEDGKKLEIEFPLFKDHKEETDESISSSLEVLVEYLQLISKKPGVHDNHIFLEFCEVSNLTFNTKGCIRYKEGIINKRSGGRFKHEHKTFLTYCGKC